MNKPIRQNGDYVIHGMMSSYFTKKLEAYFLAKGIPFQFVEMDSPGFIQGGKVVGVTQFPHLQCPDGTWLTDTTLIIEHFESDESLPALHPKDPVVAFCSQFLEDCFDEWLWAPALYFRWAFKMDNKRRSEEFSYTLLANGIKLPRFIHKRLVTWRQKDVHIKGNGIVTPAHARQIEELYLETLDLLQPVFETRPYLFGERPCEADFGLFGPMFPHFGNDPTPQEIMHVRAPHLFRWLGRLWSTRPEELEKARELLEVPEDLKPIMQKMASEYLPYLLENQKAFQSGLRTTKYKVKNLAWEVPTVRYRVYCLSQLQKRYQLLSAGDQLLVSDLLGEGAIKILAQTVNYPPEMQAVTASRPAKDISGRPVGRLWEVKSGMIETLSEKLILRKVSKSVPELKRAGSTWLPVYFKRFRAR